MKKVLPKLKRMTLKEKLFFYLNRFEQKRRGEVKDFANRQDNLLNHVMKQQRSDNLYILICTALFSIVLFAIVIIGFLLSANLIVKIIL